MISICAVIAVRNESPYLKVLLPLLAKQGIDVAIIDNGLPMTVMPYLLIVPTIRSSQLSGYLF